MHIQILKNFLSSLECKNIIQWAENIDRWNIYRTKQRIEFENKELLERCWKSLQPKMKNLSIIDEFGHTWDAIHLNEHFRLVRYMPGDSLGRHEDGFYMPNYNVRSFASLTIYLNDCEMSDGTYFNDYKVLIQPSEGNALLLWIDDILHEGLEVKNRKYILRTDVMFQARPFGEYENIRQQIFIARQEADNAENSDSCGVSEWERVCSLESELRNISKKQNSVEENILYNMSNSLIKSN
jgi:hypothetical protein